MHRLNQCYYSQQQIIQQLLLITLPTKHRMFKLQSFQTDVLPSESKQYNIAQNIIKRPIFQSHPKYSQQKIQSYIKQLNLLAFSPPFRESFGQFIAWIVIIIHLGMPKASLLPFLLLCLILSSANSVRIASVATGTVVMISAFNGSQTNTPVTITSNYSVSLATAAPNLRVALSLMSFQSIISVQFIFNATVSAVSTSSMQLTFTSFSSTYFKTAELHYLVAKHPTVDILNGCFYSGVARTGTGFRQQNFTNFTTPLISPASTDPPLQIIPAISGVKAGNTFGSLYSIGVKAIDAGTAIIGGITQTKIIITLQTEELCLVEWVCVSVIIYKPMQISSETYLRATSNIGFLMGTAAIQTYPAIVLMADVMFFGLSSLKLELLQASEHRFILSTSSTAMPTVLTTNANSQLLTLQQFFVWDAACGSGYVDTSTSAKACVATCPANYYNDSLGFCVGCSSSLLYCAVCSASGCMNCTGGLFRSVQGGTCQCMPGYYSSNGSCLLCNATLAYCLQCSSGPVCTSCSTANSSFINAVPSNGKCVCMTNYFMVNGVCRQLAGCLIMNNITSGLYCQQCSSALNFVIVGNQTCVCINYTTFNITTNKCEGPCVDGKSLDNTCDDGDTNNTNGCSNNCTVNYGFHCTNPNKYAPSVCVPIRNFTASYLYAAKETASSTAILYFNLAPDDATLYQMDFSTLVQTSIPLADMKATYVSNGKGSGTLMVRVGYTETIEQVSHNLTIYFDNAFVYAQQVDVAFVPSGMNYQLAFNPIDSFNSMISMLGAVVGGLALFLAVVSSVLGYKLIGFEVLLPVQIMYFSIASLDHTYSPLGALRSLNYSNGYNQIGPTYTLADALRSLPGLMVMERSTEFLLNVNFSAVPLLLGMAVAMAMRLAIGQRKVQQKKEEVKKGRKGNITIKIDPTNSLDNAQTHKPDQQPPKQQEDEEIHKQQVKPAPAAPLHKCEQPYVFLVDRILISLWVPLLLNTVFSFVVQTVCPPSYNSYMPLGANVGAAVFFVLLGMMCLVLLTGKIYDREFRINFHIKSRKYPVYLISLYIVQALVLASSFFDAPAASFLSIGLAALPPLLILKKQPHNTLLSLHGITAFYCQLLPPITFILLLMSRSLNGSTASLLALSILVGGLIGEGLSVVRLVLHLREDYLKRKEQQSMAKAEKEDVELQSIAHETIKKNLPQGDPLFRWDGSQKRLREAEFDSELEDEEDENDEDELARIKLRLKKELIHKRAQP